MLCRLIGVLVVVFSPSDWRYFEGRERPGLIDTSRCGRQRSLLSCPFASVGTKRVHYRTRGIVLLRVFVPREG